MTIWTQWAASRNGKADHQQLLLLPLLLVLAAALLLLLLAFDDAIGTCRKEAVSIQYDQ